VSYIQPSVDPMTRTLKVRIEAANPNMTLKPEMFVNVEFSVSMPARMTVPAEAVLDTGLKKTVFVDRSNGYLEPREVEIGERIGDRLEVLKGLTPGERIVTSGNFLIDSESQLKSSAAGMAGHQHGSAGGAGKTSSTVKPAAGQSMPGMDMPASGGPKHD
jgi:multidrug efflux pump subunit AcrA (membrane-fusion protein)